MKRSIKCALLVVFTFLILYIGYSKWIYDLKNSNTKKVNVEAGYIYPAQINGKYGFIDKNGKWVVKPKFEYAGDLIEERAVIELNGKYGFIDYTGKYVVKPKYEDCSNFSEGLAAFAEKHKYGYINKFGKIIIKPKFSNVLDFHEGLAVASSEKDFPNEGYINKKGRYYIRPIFSHAGNFSGGLACVIYPDSTLLGKTYINKKGKNIIQVGICMKDKDTFGVTDFSERLTFVKKMDNGKIRWILIDEKGNRIGKLFFDDVRDFNEGKSFVKINGKWSVIDKKGCIIKYLPYSYIGNYQEGLADVEYNNKCGYIDKNYKMIIKPQFYGFGSFKNGLAFVGLGNNKYAYINKSGKIIWHN